MFPWLSLMIWAYVITRLFQILIEYEGKSGAARGVLVTASLLGAIVATVALAAIWSAASTPSVPISP